MVTLHEDTDRIRRFVDDGSQEAFAEMVDTHAGLVYHTALRRTHDPHLAEDVTQAVFALLARRASKLRKNGSLAGWLHRTACLQAANARRGEDRHHARMKAYAKQVDTTDHTPDESNPITDNLDQALAKLAERDRQVLFLRFYEDQKLSEVGEAMGKSEDAARKQVNRALARLTSLLGRQGNVVTAVSVSTVLTQQMAKAAPPSLAGHLATKSLATAPSLSHSALLANTVLTMNSSKAIVTLALIACLPLGWQQWTLSKEQTALTNRKASIMQAQPRPSSAPTSILSQASRGKTNALATTEINTKAFAEAIREAKEDGDFILMAENERKLNQLAKEGALRLRALIEEAFSREDIDDKSRRALVNQLFERLARIDSEGAAELAWKYLPDSESDHQYHRHLSQALNNWASTAPESALEWYQSTLGSEDFELPSLRGAEQSSNAAMAGLLSGLFVSDESLAIETYQKLSEKQQTSALSQLGTDTANTPQRLETFVDLVSKHTPQNGKIRAIESLLRLERDRETAVEVIEHTNVDDSTKIRLYGFAAVPKGSFTTANLQENLSWVEEQAPDGHQEATLVEALTAALNHRQDKVSTILKEWERLSETFTDRDSALERLLSTWPLQNSYNERGLQLAASIQDRAKRLSVGRSLILPKHGQSQSNPMAALSEAGFQIEDIQAILNDSEPSPGSLSQETFQVPIKDAKF